MVYINERLRIKKIDEKCLVLEQKRVATSKKTGQSHEDWMFCGYFSNLKGALSGAYKKQLFDLASENEKNTLEEVIKKIEEYEKRLENSFTIQIENMRTLLKENIK